MYIQICAPIVCTLCAVLTLTMTLRLIRLPVLKRKKYYSQLMIFMIIFIASALAAKTACSYRSLAVLGFYLRPLPFHRIAACNVPVRTCNHMHAVVLLYPMRIGDRSPSAHVFSAVTHIFTIIGLSDF